MAAKRPTGELPKRLSKQAKLFKGDSNVSSAEAATYAGRNRDIAKKAAAKPAAKQNLIQDITNRFRVTAREARDIVTAVGTVMDATRSRDITYNNGSRKKAISAAAQNLGKQVKETGVAAATGKKGTTSASSRYTTAGEHPTRVGGSKKRR